MRRAWMAVLVFALAACGSSGGGGGNPDGGNPDGGDGGTQWDLYDVDPTASSNLLSSIPQLAIAVRSDDLVGMVWFEPTQIDDLGKTEYSLNYAAYSGGQVGATEMIRNGIIDIYGVNLTFGPDGEPVVTYLGGNQDTGPENGGATYWFQGDCAVAYRNNGTWTEQLCAQISGEPGATTGVPVDDNGDVVGLFPSVGVASDGTTYVAYRDVHYGQSPVGDFGKSDWELAFGGPTSWSHQMILAGGNNGGAYGGHSQMVMVGDQPAMISDQMPDTADGPGENVLFERRLADGGWQAPAQQPVLQISNLQSGAALAYDPTSGFGIAALDANNGQLEFVSSPDGVSQWTTPDPVVNAGTQGWYPSLAFSPTTHDPSIAYYYCSTTSGVAEGSCPTDQDELRVAERVVSRWNVTSIDPEGGFQPKIAYLSTGKRVILYRHPVTGAVRLRVEP